MLWTAYRRRQQWNAMEKRSDERRPDAAAACTVLAFTVPEFCEAHRISRALFYLLLKRGDGPRLLKAGRRTLITVDAAAEWRRRMEAATAGRSA
jgi:hypothetical protein